MSNPVISYPGPWLSAMMLGVNKKRRELLINSKSVYKFLTKQSYSWRALWILWVLFIFGNITSIPLLNQMNIPVESLPLIIFYSIFSLAVIGSALFFAGRAGFYVPYFGGLLKKNEIRNEWMKRIIAISVLVSGVSSLFILLLNLNTPSGSFPSSWALVLASIDAGVQEEIFYRLFLMSIFAWLGFLIAGRNNQAKGIVIWSSILLSGIIFGWAHIDNHLIVTEIQSSVERVFPVMIVNTLFGIVLGFLYWKQGFECAMLSHFLIDAIGLGVVLPVYLFADGFVKIIVFLVIALIVVISYRILTKIGLKDIRTFMG